MSDAASSIIGRDFFRRDPVTCARELIGCELYWNDCSGIIVETEAYTATNDEASHTFFRPSARVFVTEHDAGAAYVYMNYGMYWLLNVLVKGGTEDGFVLIRALEPMEGIPLMQRRRFKSQAAARPITALCSGPGKLSIAMGIDGRDHGRDLCDQPGVGFRHSNRTPRVNWVSDIRVGITKAVHLPWRFLADGSPFVSVKTVKIKSATAASAASSAKNSGRHR